MNRDFAEMLAALSGAGAEFLIVGAHALAAHGTPRATGDLEIWIRPTPENAALVFKALTEFGAPLADLSESDLAAPDLVFQMGLPPVRIDILTKISGVTFDEAWKARLSLQVEGQEVPVLGLAELILNKKAAARPKDLADLAMLEGVEPG